MKKLAAVLLAGALGACGGSDDVQSTTSEAVTTTTDAGAAASLVTAPTTTEPPTTTTTARPALDATAIVEAMKERRVPIGEYVAYTAENDPNEMLGRPNGYTSKVNFHDTRLEKDDEFDTNSGGTVEVFGNAEDAKRRYDYIDEISKSLPVFNEYHWQFGSTVVRVSKSLTPTQAGEYETAARSLLE